MRLFHASLASGALKRFYDLFGIPVNVLHSFAYVGLETKLYLKEYRGITGKLILDSGAWTVAKSGGQVNLNAYISYLEIWGRHFSRYFNLDTDFRDCGFDNNIAKQLRMEKAGLNPIPVVHNFFDDEIDFYVQRGKYEWLALGSSQSKDYEALQFAVYRIKKGNPKVKIHWFGGSKYEWLIHLPIASCDTSSWAMTGAYGNIRYMNKKLGKVHSVHFGEKNRDESSSGFEYTTYPWKKDLDQYLYDLFRLTPEDMDGNQSAYNRQIVNLYYFTELERRVNEERIRRGVPLE